MSLLIAEKRKAVPNCHKQYSKHEESILSLWLSATVIDIVRGKTLEDISSEIIHAYDLVLICAITGQLHINYINEKMHLKSIYEIIAIKNKSYDE